MAKSQNIDKSGSDAKPRYQVIKQHLLEQVSSGKIGPDDKTESENELASRFQVSRLTVQRAVRELVSEGVLRRVQGAGTFVAPQTTRFSLFEVRDLAEEVRKRGGEPSADLYVQRKLIPGENARMMLEIEPDTPVYQAVMLQKSDGVPFALEERYAVCDVFPDFLEQDFTTGSVYKYLSDKSVLDDVETVLKAIIPDDIARTRLEVEDGEPCLLMSRRNRMDGRVVTLTRFTYAGSKVSLGSRVHHALTAD